MPIQIGIDNAIKGGSGTGTGGGGGGDVFTDVFDVTALVGETVSFYASSETAPAIVDWGDGSPTETINLSVLQTHTYPAGSYVISISGGAVELFFDSRASSSDLSLVTNVLSLSKLIFGVNSSLSTCPANVTYTSTDTPGLVTSVPTAGASGWFPTDADNYPTSIPNWQVDSVDDFGEVFEVNSPLTLDVDVSSWVFKTGATIVNSFQYLTDARIAECFVGWDASGVTNVTLDNAFRPRLVIGGVYLDPVTYPAAKAAYDNLISTKGWVDNGSVFWFSGLLDTYTGAAAGYSVRRLASATTTLMRVRRSGLIGGVQNDDEADVAYDSNNVLGLDSPLSNADAGVLSTTLGEFVGLGTNPDGLDSPADGYVATWFDQSGNANDATQAAVLNQPQVITAGVIEVENGKPAIDCLGTGYFDVASSISDPFTMSVVMKYAGTSQYMVGGALKPSFYFSGTTLRVFAGSWSNVGTRDTSQANYVGIYDAAGTGEIIGRVNTTETIGSSAATSYTPAAAYKIGANYVGTRLIQETIQEVIIWNSNQKSATNIDGIQTNINTFFSIYP